MAACGDCGTGKCPLNLCIDKLQHICNKYITIKMKKYPNKTNTSITVDFNSFIIECDCIKNTYHLTPLEIYY